MKIESTKDIRKEEKVHICLIGASKTGKTKMLETLKGKTLILNADKGLLSLKGSKDIDAVRVTTFEEVIEFMRFIKGAILYDKEGNILTLEESKKIKPELLVSIDTYENIAVDSFTVVADLLLKFLKDKDIKGFDKWEKYSEYIGGIITTLRDSTKFNSVSIFELVHKEDKNGVLKKAYGLQGSLASRVPYFYDFVFATRKKVSQGEVEYFVQTQSKDGFDCGSRLEGLDTFIEPDLGKLINKLRS